MSARSLDDARSQGGPARPGDGDGAAGAGAEEELAVRAARGDMGAFDALVTVFNGRVFALAMRMLGDRGEAEDLTQEVFVAVHRALATFRAESRVSTWIYRITRNRCLNRLQALRRRRVGAHGDIDDPVVAREVVDPETQERGARGPGHTLERDDLRALLEHHLRALPEEQRLLIILRDLEDLSYDEIVEVTGVPLGTVKSRLHRARLELAARLGPRLRAAPVASSTPSASAAPPSSGGPADPPLSHGLPASGRAIRSSS